MARIHNPGGFKKGARHLSQRGVPFVSVISSALSSITDHDVFPHSNSDDPLPTSDIPIPSGSLSSDVPHPVSVSIPGFSITPLPPSPSPSPPPPPLHLAPSDTNSSSSISTGSISTSSNTDLTSSVSTSRPPNSTLDSSNTINSTPGPPSPSSTTTHLTPNSISTNSRESFSSTAFANTGSSTITEVYTTTSGNVALEITTIIPPSLSSNPGSESSFFKDKGQAAAVLTIAILVGILGFSFLGYRFVKTVKNRQLERDLQEASRLNRSRAILDDGEDDGFSADYSMRQTDSDFWNDPSSSDRHVGRTRSGSTIYNESSVGHTSFERALRGRVSSEEDGVSPAEANGSTLKGPIIRLGSNENLIARPSTPVVLGPVVSASSRNPFLVRREDIEPPTPPVLPDSFGEDTSTSNAISSPASVDDRNAFYLRQQNLKITNQ